MSLKQQYGKILSEILSTGTIGISLLLGTTAPGGANRDPMDWQLSAETRAGVAERLAAVREAVSDLVPVAEQAEDEQQLAWGNWRNGGWRNGGWRNWRNGWHNGGWGNWWRNW